MRKNYVAPSLTEKELLICDVLSASGITDELGGDGKIAPDIFYEE